MSVLSRFFAATGAAVSLTVAAVSAHATVLTFHTLSDFTSVVSNRMVEDFEGAPWAPVGIKAQPVIDDGLSWYSVDNFFVTDMVANSSALSITSLDNFNAAADHTDLLSVYLPSGITAVGMFVSTLGQDHGVEIRAFDAADHLLVDAVSNPTGPTEFDFLGVVSIYDIRHVDFFSTTPPQQDDIALDDFNYGTWNFAFNATSGSVPEPAALTLLASALGMLALVGRGRRR